LKNELPEFFQIIVLSIPNLIEAIVGTLISIGVLFQLRQYIGMEVGNFNDKIVYLAAVSIAGLYVISQEFKFHNLGGNNVYDPYDVYASIIGLILTLGLVQAFGFIKERKTNLANS